MSPETATIGGSQLLSVGTSLIVIVLAIVALGWLFSRSRSLSGGRSDVINVVASRALGTRERLLLVEVADQQL
ncbi:MAG: flagellar biosynthetic protein FliO, partial [Pseudomonadota bacterium]